VNLTQLKTFSQNWRR